MITLSDSCAKQINALKQSENTPDMMLRVTVNGGGCQGFEYALKPDTTKNDDDVIFEKDGAVVITDAISFKYLSGSEVDYIDDLIGAHFKVNNPNATSSCGCGTSFNV